LVVGTKTSILLVSSYDAVTDVGGHYYTVNAYYQALSTVCKCEIVNIGLEPCRVFAPLGQDNNFVRLSAFTLPWGVYKVFRMLQAKSPCVLHSFDGLSFVLANWASRRLHVGHVHTKCGGPPPQRRFPVCNDLILFSKEDMAWFGARPEFRDSHLIFMPNRVVYRSPDHERIRRFKSRFLREGYVHIVAVMRFVKYKHNQFMAALKLAENLRSLGVKTQLTIIGAIQEPAFYREVRALTGEDDLLLTAAEHTVHASEFLACADITLATGRAAMEAAGYGLITCLPSADGSISLLCLETVEAGLKHNFSVRAQYDGWDAARTCGLVHEMLTDASKRDRYQQEVHSISTLYFSLESKLPQLADTYRSSSPSPVKGTGIFWARELRKLLKESLL
jgi:hypothetical protein